MLSELILSIPLGEEFDVKSIDSIPENLTRPLFHALVQLFNISQKMGHNLVLEPVTDQLDIFAASDTLASDMKWILEAIYHVNIFDQAGFVWGFEAKYGANWKEPQLILSLDGVLRPCSCQDGKLKMGFENGRNSASRLMFNPNSPVPQVNRVQQIECICPCCKKRHPVDEPTDPHTLEHWEHVLAIQDNKDYYGPGIALRR